jgi:class 3 adenylate cyclase
MSTIQINEQLLDKKLAEIEQARQWSARVIAKLETAIRTADDDALFRINPIQFATEKGMAETEAIDLFLHGTKHGLFEIEWHLVCAFCGHMFDSLRELSKVHAHFVCNFCYAENDVALDDYIQVTFTISPQVRAIAFHDPETLSIEDYYLKYCFAQGIRLPPGGPTFVDVVAFLTKLLTYLSPHEKRTVELDLPPGLLQASDDSNNTSMTFFVNESPSADVQRVPIKLVGGKFQAIDRLLKPQDVQNGPVLFKFQQAGELTNGKVVFELENLMDKKSPIWMGHFPPSFTRTNPLQFEPFLSAKRLLTTQTFRDLFRSETVSSQEGIGVKEITFLFTDLKGSTALYDQVGDPKAYYLVRQHFDTLGRVIAQHSGAIVKTIGDAVMATFLTPLDAVQAATAMLKEIEDFNRGISENLILKIGIHKGHSIAVTVNDRLDYFGQTVNIAARVQGLAEAGEIYVSQDVYEYPGLAEVLAEYQVVPKQTLVKGVSEQIQVYKITVHPEV